MTFHLILTLKMTLHFNIVSLRTQSLTYTYLWEHLGFKLQHMLISYFFAILYYTHTHTHAHFIPSLSLVLSLLGVVPLFLNYNYLDDRDYKSYLNFL